MNQKLKASLFILLTFIFGIVTGILMSNFVPGLSINEHRNLKLSKKFHKTKDYERVIKALNFTPDQKTRFKQAMEHHAQRMHVLFEQNKPQMRQSWNLLMADLDSFLTQDQKNQLEKRLLQRRRFKGKRPYTSNVKMKAKIDTLK